MGLLITLSLLVIGYLAGQYFEKQHYKSLRDKEKYFINKIEVMTNNKFYSNVGAKQAVLVVGNTVVASDYFKNFLAGLISLFGGRISVYETLLDRGRREALVRLYAEADKLGAHKIINLRVDTVNVNSVHGKAGIPMIECFAYGTAISE